MKSDFILDFMKFHSHYQVYGLSNIAEDLGG